LRLPRGVIVQPEGGNAVDMETPSKSEVSYRWKSPPVPPGQTVSIRFRLSTDGSAQAGYHPAALQAAALGMDEWTEPVALPVTIGPVLIEDDSFPTFGEYVIYAARYTLRLSKRYGTSRFWRDNAGRPRCEATFWNRRPTAKTTPEALPRLRLNDQDALAWGSPVDYLWPNHAPASVSVGTAQSRIEWSFEDDAIRLEPVALWSAEAPHEFIFPGGPHGWTVWTAEPQWLQIVAVDDEGAEQVLDQVPEEPHKILAAALHVPGFDDEICFAVDRPQTARFDGATLRLSVYPGEPLWFGLARTEEFEQWWKARQKR
jgi:hypothetical protein